MSALMTASPLEVSPSLLVLLDTLEQAGAITQTALTLESDIDYDTYEALGAYFGSLTSASKWWLGDWLIFGEKSYEEDRWAQACHATGREVGTLRNYLRVCLAVAPKQRNANVSFSHHIEVASLGKRDQTKYLRRAERERLSVAELRHLIAVEIPEENPTTSGESTRPKTTASNDDVRMAAAAVWHQAQRDGDSAFYLVPVDVMQRLAGALGYH